MSSLQQYIELYESQAGVLCGGSCDVMNARREAALDVLRLGGWPSAGDERYKYTDVEADFAPDYGINLRRALPAVDPYKAYRCAVPNLSTVLYFVEGDVPYVKRPAGMSLPDGVRIEPICEAARRTPGLLDRYYHRLAAEEPDGVTALNTLLAQDGLFIYLPAGVRLAQPIQIVNVAAAQVDMMVNRRVVVVAETGAEASLLFCDHADGRHRTLATQVTEIYAGHDTRLQCYAIEETAALHTSYHNIYVRQQDRSHVSYNGFTLTCGVTRNRLDFRLAGSGADMVARGVVVADDRQRVDNSLLVDHAAPHCTSNMLYKYVLDGDSVGAFAGKVLVREGAQKSLSDQTNANLCASPNARAYSQPMLEIYADDVRCNHGSTIGKLDETALFYMRQRGIEEAEARLLLQYAFVGEVIRHIEMEHLRDRIAHLVEMRFRGRLSACKGCRMCPGKGE